MRFIGERSVAFNGLAPAEREREREREKSGVGDCLRDVVDTFT